MNSFKYKIIIYCSQHYWKLLALSIVLLFTVCFHKVFNLLPQPVTANGIVIADKVISSGHQRAGRPGTAISIVPTIEFEYTGQKYLITGGSSQEFKSGQPATVIFNKNKPQKACELSFMGLIDFPFTYYVLVVWFIFSAFLYGTTTFDKHFPGFSINIRNIPISRVITLSVLILTVPLLKNVGLLLHGVVGEAVVTDTNRLYGDGVCYSTIRYNIDGHEYEITAQNLSDDKMGKTVSIIYEKNKPDKAQLNNLFTFYLNTWLIISGGGVVFIIAIFLGSRIKDDDD